jgi:hypothetical protein
MLFLAACTPAAHATTKPAQAVANPCAQTIVYPVSFQPHLDGYLALWPSPPVPGSTTPGRLNSQQIAAQGNPKLHDLGSQGPLAASHYFSVHYSLQNASPSADGCDLGGAFWSLDCQDGTSRYADLWAHSDPCVWDQTSL